VDAAGGLRPEGGGGRGRCQRRPSAEQPPRRGDRALLRPRPDDGGPGIKTGLKIHYRDPKEVGADRIVAAMAAFKKYGGPLIIIDFGTGTTYDVVSGAGDYLGGAIAPGMGISVEALYERAARLQRVELKAPPTVIGRTTAESMQAGIIFGFTAQVEGMVA